MLSGTGVHCAFRSGKCCDGISTEIPCMEIMCVEVMCEEILHIEVTCIEILRIQIYIYSTNIPPIMIINRIYETQNRLSL